jgi:hypothetical protein
MALMLGHEWLYIYMYQANALMEWNLGIGAGQCVVLMTDRCTAPRLQPYL